MKSEFSKLHALNFLGVSDITKEDPLEEANAFMGNLRPYILMQQLYNAAIHEVYTKLQILNDEFHVRYDHNPIHNIETRLKSARSIMGKLQKKNIEPSIATIRENIFDIAGIRVICNYIDDIYRIEQFLRRQDDIRIVRVRDYIKNPKANGYRSLHLIVQIPVYLSESTEHMHVEIQVRTIAMDFWASLEHSLKYKSKQEIDDDLKKRLTKCSGMIAALDEEMQQIHEEISKE